MSKRELPSVSLLDAGGLPIVDLARLARRESVRPRDAYQAHKWFARRLSTTARSLLAAALTDSKGDFWNAYYGGSSAEGLTVLDPFMGGGVMVLEASRFGAGVYGTDVEPVAAAIADFQGKLHALPDLSPDVEELVATVGKELLPYYRAFDYLGNEERLLHAFWVQRVECGQCGHEYDAHPHFRLAWSEEKKRQWVVCSGCSEILETSTTKKTIRCGCGTTTKTDGGRLVRGDAHCPQCGHSEALIDVARRAGKPSFRLFAVESIECGDEKRRVVDARRLRRATERDGLVYDKAVKRLAKELKADPEFIVRGKIPQRNRFDDRLLKYGYRDYAELHNARQQLHLGLLARALKGYQGIVGDALKIAFSDHLTTNNMMCAYAGGWRRLTPLFSIRAYRHIARPVELNPWLTKNGRGTFPNAVRSVVRAAASVVSEDEPSADGGSRTVRRCVPGVWDIRCQDANDLDHIAEGSVDLVLTDPPYFDYIAYSELGHFFAPWMARLGLIRSRRLAAQFPKGQLASKGNMAATSDRFAEELSKRLSEVVRVCKPTARVVFTYQSKDVRGWRALGAALAANGIRPLQAWPMFSDTGAGLHKHPNSISWDCVLHCDLHGEVRPLVVTAVSEIAGIAFEERWRHRLRKAGYVLSAGDTANLVHAGTIIAALNSEVVKANEINVRHVLPTRANR